MKSLTIKDAERYLESGNLSKPFLDNNYINEKVETDYQNKLKLFGKANKLQSLYLWIHKNLDIADEDFKKKYKFMRTAQEIWESGKATGCTDYALVFSTFARQIGIPTTLLHTSERGFLNKVIENKTFTIRRGHSFCECFYDGKWILVDPTKKVIMDEYNSDIIQLPYSIGEEGMNTFIPYYRGLDLCRKMTHKEHAEFEDDCIIKTHGNISLK